jgi:hypothetical protein
MLSSLRGRLETNDVTDGDESLDLLVKHALKSHAPQMPTPSSNNVWSKLSKRVRGPFGKIAVEGPAASGDELAINGPNISPFAVGDEKRTPLPSRNSQEASEQHTALFPTAKEAIHLI